MPPKMLNGKSCDQQIAPSTQTFPHSEAKKKPIFAKWWFWVIFALISLGIAAGNNGERGNNAVNTMQTETNHTQQYKQRRNEELSAAAGGGISAAEMGADRIGHSAISDSAAQTAGNAIAEMQLYAIPLDLFMEKTSVAYFP